MDNVDFEKILQMVEKHNREGLEALPHECLVEFIIKCNSKYIREKAERYQDDMMKALQEFSSRYGSMEDRGVFINHMRDKDKQLAEAEAERDNLREKNEALEEELELIQARVDELEKKLATAPKAGRPDKYDAKFRAEVRAYHEAGHTYRDTAEYFNISTNTVGRFLKA